MAIRYDSGRFSKVVPTRQGGIRVEAAVSRTGILRYKNPDGSARRELRLPEDVFHEDSLDSLRGAPATHYHPGGMVGPDNFRSVAVGYMADNVRADGATVVGEMLIQDGGMVTKVHEGDLKELSAGYTCRLDETPGEYEGQPYDAIQRDIRFNHVALLPPGAGRSGPEVSLRLDAAGDCTVPDTWAAVEDPSMKIELIDGTEYEIGTDAHATAVSARDEAARKDAEDRAALEARADAAEAALAEAKTHAEGEDARVLSAVEGRLALHRKAVEAGVEIKADATDADIRLAVIAKVLPALDLADREDAYIRASFDLAMDQIGAADLGGLRKTADAASRADAADDAPPVPRSVKARADMLDRLSKAHENPRAGK